MKLKKALEYQITIYWWNMGKKLLDYKGNYKDYLKKTGIKVRNRKNGGFLVKFSFSNENFTIIISNKQPLDVLDGIIVIYLFELGDKTLFTGRRTHKINWG